jgi:hypothetical protein
MPTNLVDVDVWSDTVVGPADGDLSNAATYLQPSQILANRTRYLLNEHPITPAALGLNTDSLNPTGWSDATLVVLSTSSLAGFIAGANASVRRTRKTLLNLGPQPIALQNDATTAGAKFATPFGETQYVMYAGESVDIVLVSGVWRILDSKTQFFRNSIQLSGSSSEVLYTDTAGSSSPRTRTVMLPLGAVDGAEWQPDISGRHIYTAHNNSHYHAGIQLPGFSRLTRVRALVEHGTSIGVFTINVFKAVADKTAPYGASSMTTLGTTTSPTAAGVHLLEISLDELIDNANATYKFAAYSSDGAGSEIDKILWVELQFSDPGPRNY